MSGFADAIQSHNLTQVKSFTGLGRSLGALRANAQMTGNTLLSADTNGNIILDPNGTGQVQVNADRLVIKTTKTATAVGNTGDVAGSISWDATNLYVCTGNYDGSTVIWKKITLASI